MDRFVKNFIGASIFYLAVAAVIGVMMLSKAEYLQYRFVHSHLMLLGWVSMMIYGVGYHILPRFAGKFIKSKAIGEAQFWLSNIGLIGMVIFHALSQKNPGYSAFSAFFGGLEVLSIFMFFYNMIATLYSKDEAH